MERITIKDLEKLVKTINQLTQSPPEYSGVNGINIGHYYLDGAYGGWKLVQTVNNSGGVRAIGYGYEAKRVLYGQLRVFIEGIRTPEQGHKRTDLGEAV